MRAPWTHPRLHACMSQTLRVRLSAHRQCFVSAFALCQMHTHRQEGLVHRDQHRLREEERPGRAKHAYRITKATRSGFKTPTHFRKEPPYSNKQTNKQTNKQIDRQTDRTCNYLVQLFLVLVRCLFLLLDKSIEPYITIGNLGSETLLPPRAVACALDAAMAWTNLVRQSRLSFTEGIVLHLSVVVRHRAPRRSPPWTIHQRGVWCVLICSLFSLAHRPMLQPVAHPTPSNVELNSEVFGVFLTLVARCNGSGSRTLDMHDFVRRGTGVWFYS